MGDVGPATPRVFGVALMLFLLVDGAGKVMRLAPYVEGTAKVGYPSGATVTHVRLGPPFRSPSGVLVWGRLYLRDPRVRALLPLVHRP